MLPVRPQEGGCYLSPQETVPHWWAYLQTLQVLLGVEVALVSFEGRSEVTLVSLGDREMVPKAHMPDNTKKYRQWLTINGQRVYTLRDTGPTMTHEMSSGVFRAGYP